MNQPTRPRRLALVVSKGTLDMAYPPLTFAASAASMDWEVGILFTAWALDIIHKERQHHLAVSPIGNPAMPPPFASVPLKVPTLMGVLPGMTAIATAMAKGWMDHAGMETIPSMLDIARELGVRLYACSTTLRVLSVDPKDLIDGVELLAFPAFLDYAAEADVQFFV